MLWINKSVLLFGVVVVLYVFVQTAHSQSYVLEVGKQYELPIIKPTSIGVNTITANVKISNPTVFFPDGLSVRSRSTFTNQALTRLTDSTYTIQATFEVNDNSDTAMFLWGTALAGNDSTTVLTFENFTVNGNIEPNYSINLLSTSVGTRRPYVRFSVFDPGFPNPISSQETITFAYQIDLPSDVRFYAVTLNGTQTLIGDFKNVPFGVHRFQFTPGPLWGSGNYWVMFETVTGTRYQPLHIRN